MDLTEIQDSHEMENTVDHAWLFDVDGVITHPEQKKVTEPEIFNEIIKRLTSGEPVALVTGRSLTWMTERVIDPLVAKIDDKSLLRNFFGLGEKGGVWVTFDSDGNRQETIDENVSVPQFLQEEVREMIENRFSDTMCFDDSKKTMISTEMRDDITVNQFQEPQRKLTKELQNLLQKHELFDSFNVDPTRIATDIENKHVGKALGSQKVLEWLRVHNIRPESFIAFGDSKSDVPMAQFLHDQGLSVTLVFVGGSQLLEGQNFQFPVIFTQGLCEKGTLEYLSSH